MGLYIQTKKAVQIDRSSKVVSSTQTFTLAVDISGLSLNLL